MPRGGREKRPPRGVSFLARRSIPPRRLRFMGGILLCTIPCRQLLQGKTKDAFFEMQKGFLPALHDEAVKNVAHGEQKFF